MISITKGKRIQYRAENIVPTLMNVPLFLADINIREGSDLEVADRIFRKWKKAKELYDSDFSQEVNKDGELLTKEEIFKLQTKKSISYFLQCLLQNIMVMNY